MSSSSSQRTTVSSSKILILQQRNWGLRIGHDLAVRFHADGFRLGAVTFKKQTDAFVRAQKAVPYELVISHDAIQEDQLGYAESELPSLAEVCDGLGLETVWLTVQSLRNHIRSYRDRYYYGYKQNVSDDVIVRYVRAAYQACNQVFDDFGPDVIVTPNFVSLFHVFLSLTARRRGVPMIGVTDSKVRRRLVFTHSHLDDQGPFIDRISELNAGAASAQAGTAEEYLAQNRVRLKAQGWGPPPKRPPFLRSLRMLARHLRASVRQPNRLERLPGLVDARSPRIVVRDFFAHAANARTAERFPYVDLASVGDFVYMPLAYQPESSIDLQAARFNNQIETARQVAMSLPDQLTLVVKDHPAMYGLRPPSYLEKVARTPNVKLVDFRLSTEAVLDRAHMVIAPVGTTFIEAALLRIPAVQLGDLGTTLMLPNVVRHTDLSTLPGRIKDSLTMDCRSNDYDRRLRNFVAAAFDVGFDHNYMEGWQATGTADRAALYDLFKAEVVRALDMAERQSGQTEPR